MVRYLIWLLIGVIIGASSYWLFQQYNSASVSPPVTRTILIYFNKSEPTDIVQVAVERDIFKTVAVATAAMQELLKGPTASEKAEGLTTAINAGTILNYVRIDKGIATVDFNDQFDFQMGGSARVRAIYQQIYKTLTQFSTIKSIQLTINHGERPANLEP